MLSWIDREERGLAMAIGSLNVSAEPHVWDRQVAQMRGVLLFLRLLKTLPADAKKTVEKLNKESA